jgi:hypothetical protein
MLATAEEDKAGLGAGCCIDKKVRMDFFSTAYELSASVFPLDANRQAAIHRAYCSSLSHLICNSVIPPSDGTSNLIPYLPGKHDH